MNEPFMQIAPVALGFLLDFLIGDPHSWPHPIRLIGKLISSGENFFRKNFGEGSKSLFICGAVLSVIVVATAFLVPWFLLEIAEAKSRLLKFVLETIFCYQILAARSLKDESLRVYKRLLKNDIEGARRALSMIVGRDTRELDREQISKAAVETVAENCSDGVIAPLLFMVIGGAPLGFMYKAVNTLDSMVGYKNERYLYFGKFAARLDDVVNIIPSRICAWLMLLVGALQFGSYNFSEGLRIYRRDSYKHSSPNSAHTEAACAGLLCVRLAGDAYYGGKLVQKPFIGDPLRCVSPDDIVSANRLMYSVAVLALVVFSLIKIILLFV